MQGYEPQSGAEKEKGYPTQSTPIMPQVGYPSTAYQAPEPGFAPAPAFQHVPISDEDPIVKGMAFSTESIRKGFIRKVYTILSVIIYSAHIPWVEAMT